MANYMKIVPTLPVVDIKRAKTFYREKLGCTVSHEDPGPGASLSCNGSEVYLYQRAPSKADHTLVDILVDDIERAVGDLRGKGVKFEEYDIPSMGIKTVNGIANMSGTKGAWFKDSEGNILGVTEMSRTGHPGEREKTGETVVSP